MNTSDEIIEPETDLELALNHSSLCFQKESNGDSGAGANAASHVGISFVANVSEIVWSPVKGPRVKRADQSFTDKKASVFGDAGPSNVFPHEKLIDEENSPQRNNDAVSHANKKEHTMDSSGKAEFNSAMGEKNESLLAKSGHVDVETPENLFVGAEEHSTDLHVNGHCDENIGSSSRTLEAGNNVEREIQHISRHDASRIPVISSGRLVGKKASYAENDVQMVDDGRSIAAVCKIAISLGSHGHENKGLDRTLVLQCDKNSQPTCFATSSRTHHLSEKYKGKALSDEDEKISNEDDESHVSVESCNSARQFSTGKRQWNFEQQFWSKRVKRSLDEPLDSPPSIRRDSSFMNWISNMMKGFSPLRQDQVTPPVLTFGHSCDGHQMLDRKLVKLRKDQDPGCRSKGFQSFFQSIYSSSSKNNETRKLSKNQLEDNAMDLELVNKVISNTPVPLAYCPESGRNGERVLQLTHRSEGSPCPNEVAPLSGIARNLVTDQENSKHNPSGNENSCSSETSKEKGQINSTSYFAEHKMDIGTDALFEANPSPLDQTKDVGGNLWITRFSSKSISPMPGAHPLQISDEGCSKLPQTTGSDDGFRTVDAKKHSGDEKLPSETRQQCGTVTSECSGPKSATASYGQKPVDELNNIYQFSGLKTPEKMASLFARRLDALKNNVPSNVEDESVRANMICFFCGLKGHQLRNCTEISGNKVKDLPERTNTYGKLKKGSSMHPECSEVDTRSSGCHDVFQPRLSGYHVLSSGKHVPQASNFTNHNTPHRMKDDADSVDDALHIAREEGNCHVATVHDAEQRSKEGTHSEQKSSRQLTPKNLGIHSRNRNGEQVSNVPKGIFEAVKKLQLSRSDILKWTNSPMPSSHLDGFFLRLRVGKWEEGLGGTGYHVASITGSHGRRVVENANACVSVNVKGLQCLVDSQYISNHHFLEDELMAWWSTTSQGGGNRLPSEQELVEKIKLKESLGF